MRGLLPARLLGVLLLFLVAIPSVQAVAPSWIVPASPGVDLSTVVLSADGSTVVAGGSQLIALSSDGTKLWSGWSGTLLDVSRDGKYIVTSQGPSVRLVTRQGTLLWDRSLVTSVTAVSITPDATMIAAGGGNTVQSWYNSGSGLGTNVTETVHDVKISPAKDQIIVATAKALRSFNMSYVPNWYDDTFSPASICLSGDGTGIVIPNGNRIRMYHGSGTLLWDRSLPGGNIISLAYSRDGSTIVAGRDDSTVVALDREGTVLWTGKAGFWVTSVGVSDDGSIIATGSIDNQIHIFNRQGIALGSYVTKGPIKSRSIAVSGDGSLIVAADLTNVYGFSRSQFTLPTVSSAVGGAGNVSPGSLQANGTIISTMTTVPPAAIVPSLSGTAAAPVTSPTPSANLPWVLTLVPLSLAFLLRRR